MLRNGQRFEWWLGWTLPALALIVLASPVQAGQAGNLQPVGKLLIELDAETSQFRLDDGDPATPDPVQLIFDQKIIKWFVRVGTVAILANLLLAILAPLGAALFSPEGAAIPHP